MTRSLRGVLAVAVTLTALLAVPFAADAAPAKCTSSNTTTIRYGLRGSSLRMNPGTCLKVSLTTYSDGGYYWRTIKKANRHVLASVSRTQVYPKLPPGYVGGNSTTNFLYRTGTKGTTSFTLAQRQGTTKRSSDQIFSLTVTVR